MINQAIMAAAAIAAPHAAPVNYAASTSYCLNGTTADGTYLNKAAPSKRALRTVAMNRHPLGTKIKLVGMTFRGRTRFVVRDRIGHSSELDFWSSSCAHSIQYGRKTVKYRIVK